jgi:hypothetical protein
MIVGKKDYIKSGSYMDSIQDDYIVSMRSKRSPEKLGDSSIGEDSQLNLMSAGKGSNNKQSIIEESINERGSDYDKDYEEFKGSKLKLSKLKMDEHHKQV